MFRRKPKVQIEVEWLIVGLGNPGPEYSGTRHNVGFEVVDRLCKRHGIKLDRSKHKARFGTGSIGSTGVVVVKPMTYMNLSGQAVAPLLRDQKLELDRLIVVSDETDLPLGRLRIRETGGSGGHNGHKSLIGSLGSQDYARIRLGIGRVEKDETIEHVLGRFDADESQDAHEMIDRAADAVEFAIANGIEAAMNKFNA